MSTPSAAETEAKRQASIAAERIRMACADHRKRSPGDPDGVARSGGGSGPGDALLHRGAANGHGPARSERGEGDGGAGEPLGPGSRLDDVTADELAALEEIEDALEEDPCG